MTLFSKRGAVLFTCVALTSSLLAGCGDSGKSTSTESAGQAKPPFAGKKITVYVANHPWGETVKKMLPEFEKQTGMQVELQSFAEDQLTQKLTVQLTSGSETPQVFMHRPLQEAKLFYKNGWLQPLDEYVKKDASYDFADISKSSLDSSTVDNKLTSIPIISEQEILYYRKDLLEKAGIAVPKTWDELEAAAKKLHEPDKGVYGFVARGSRQMLVTQVSSYLFSEGGDFMQGDKATVNTPEAIKGFSRYANLLKSYGPPGVLNFSWPQAMGVFAQGKAAFFTDANSIYKNAVDPEKSTIGDKVGYAVLPGGKAGSKPFNVTSWALAMNAKASNKDAAWAFIQWASGKEVVLQTQKQGNPGVRASIWDNPEGVSGFPKEMVPVIKESIKIGVGHDRPLIISVGEARDVIGDIVVKAILGQDIQQVADKANQDFQALIDKDKTR